jgi:hypothetical protein
MFQISNFSSVLEVSIGIHIAYGFFPSINKYFQKKHEKIMGEAKMFINNINDLEAKKKLKTFRNLMKLTSVASTITIQGKTEPLVRISFLIAFFSLIILILSGLQPKLTVHFSVIILILSLALLPMPAMLFYSFILQNNKVKKNEDYLKKMREFAFPILNKQEVDKFKELRNFDFFK